MKQKELATLLDDIIDNLETTNVLESKEKLRKMSKELKESNEIQFASSKMLNYFVNDMLTLAQIKNGKFRKECSNFDIRIAIKEVMMIQKHKAEILNINFTCEYNGFVREQLYLLCTDMQRMQQVILNF